MRCPAPHTPAARAPWLVLVAWGLTLASTTSCRTAPAQALAAPERAATSAAPRDPLQRDVALLRSADFVERSRAGERLVGAGERALPALGAAGEGTVRVLGTQEVGTVPPVVRTILEDVDLDRLGRHLDSPWPVVRRETAAELGRRGRWRAVPYLIPRLDDDDREVRAASASSLRRLTNRFFGFDANAQLQARRRATQRWREWWSVEGRLRAAGDTGGGAG